MEKDDIIIRIYAETVVKCKISQVTEKQSKCGKMLKMVDLGIYMVFTKILQL